MRPYMNLLRLNALRSAVLRRTILHSSALLQISGASKPQFLLGHPCELYVR